MLRVLTDAPMGIDVSNFKLRVPFKSTRQKTCHVAEERKVSVIVDECVAGQMDHQDLGVSVVHAR